MTDAPAKRILLTGASGFIGRHALRALLDSGHDVVAATRNANTARGLFPDVQWIEGDLLDRDARGALIETAHADTLLHIAWDVSPGYWSAAWNFDWLAASIDLARRFRDRGGTRIAMAGTCAEYDWRAKDAETGKLSESESRFSPSTLYALSKQSLRTLLAQWASENGLSFAAGLVFFTHGPDEHGARLVPAVIQDFLAGRPARVSAGSQIRDFIDSRDVGAALAALAAGNVTGAVNIGSGVGRSVREIVNIIRGKIDPEARVDFGAIPARPNEPPYIVADTTRLIQEVGFTPQFDLEDGLAHCIDWWRTQLNPSP